MSITDLIRDRLLEQQRNNGSEEIIRVLNELREAAEALERKNSTGLIRVKTPDAYTAGWKAAKEHTWKNA